MSSPPAIAPAPSTPSPGQRQPARRRADYSSKDQQSPRHATEARRGDEPRATDDRKPVRQSERQPKETTARTDGETRHKYQTQPTVQSDENNGVIAFAQVLAQNTPVEEVPLLAPVASVPAPLHTPPNASTDTAIVLTDANPGNLTTPTGVTIHYSGFAAAPSSTNATTAPQPPVQLTASIPDAAINTAPTTSTNNQAQAIPADPLLAVKDTAVTTATTTSPIVPMTTTAGEAKTTAKANINAAQNLTDADSNMQAATTVKPANNGQGTASQQQFSSLLANNSAGAVPDIAGLHAVAVKSVNSPIPSLSATAAMQATQAMQAAAEAAPDPVSRALGRQVANAIHQGWQQEMPLVVRLTPPELGTLRIVIQDGPNGVSIRIASEDEGVRHALERALPNVRQEMKADPSTVHITIENQNAELLTQDDGHRDNTRNDNNDETPEDGATFADHLSGDVTPETPPGRPLARPIMTASFHNLLKFI